MSGIGELVKALSRAEVDKLWTITAAVVDSVNYSANTADVRILNLFSDDGEPVRLKGLPVVYLSSSAGTFMSALSKGDQVLVLFGRYSLSQQILTESLNEGARFSMNNGVVLAGFFSKNVPPYTLSEGDLLIRHKSGAGIRIDANGDMKIVAKSVNFIKLGNGAL